MKKLFFSILLLATIQVISQNFDTYFKDLVLRVDVNLYGTDKITMASIAQLKQEPLYGGSHKNLIFPDFGNFRIRLSDAQKGTLLYSKGFSSLFPEWQATEEAKQKQRIFYHAFQVPFPKNKVIFELQKRNWDGVFETILSEKISPDDYFIIKEKSTSYPIKKLQNYGEAKNKVDIAIIPEGYTVQEMDKFYADAERMITYMFTIPPFDKNKDKFNIYAVGAPSLESGTDNPGENVYKNTLVNSTFYTFNTPRYLTTTDMKSVCDVAALVPYDQIYVLVNTPTYGGGGFYNFINLTSVDHQLSTKVFVHEFGHGFVGLADEYYDSSTAFNDLYNQKVEPWEPNITTLTDFDNKWKNLLSKGVPVPTPRTEIYKDQVGVFEGGGYVAKGIYSPVQDCRMKSNVPDGFCPVCSEAIQKTIEFYCD